MLVHSADDAPLHSAERHNADKDQSNNDILYETGNV